MDKRKLFVSNLILTAIALLFFGSKVFAAYNPSYLISDKIFRDTSTFTTNDIQNFLASKSSGLTNYHDVENCGDPSGAHYSYYATYYSCGQSVLASKIIYDAGQAYGINPRAILATLQKEQSLVTTPNPTQSQIDWAMGYGCPNSCDSTYKGFFNQVDNGIWQFRFDYEGALHHTNWSGWSPDSWYSSVCGTAHSEYSPGLYPGNTVTFADPWYQGDPFSTSQPRTVTIANASTATLYCYTPFVGPYSDTGYSGSYNFVTSFEAWFGSVASPCYNDNNISGVTSGRRIMAKNTGAKADNLSLIFLNVTGSACIEAHTWGANEQSWVDHVASNHPVVNLADDEVISADLNGDGKDELILVKYRNDGSGKIEIHIWDPTLQQWTAHIATNHPAVDPADDRVVAGDPEGDGTDKLFLVKYRNSSSGKVEIHEWDNTFQHWVSNLATNLPAVNPADTKIMAVNTANDGDNKDKFILVKYRNTASGKIEIHTWNPGYQSWYSNVATNHPAVDPANDEIISADTYGEGKQRLILIKYSGGASGKVEVHTWNPDLQSWYSNIATNYPAITW